MNNIFQCTCKSFFLDDDKQISPLLFAYLIIIFIVRNSEFFGYFLTQFNSGIKGFLNYNPKPKIIEIILLIPFNVNYQVIYNKLSIFVTIQDCW